MGSFDHWGFLPLIWRVYFKDKVDIKTEIYSSSDNSSDISLSLTLMFSCNRHTSLFKLLKKIPENGKTFFQRPAWTITFFDCSWRSSSSPAPTPSHSMWSHTCSHWRVLKGARFGMSSPFYDANRNFLCSLSSLDYQIVHWDHQLL